MILEGYNLGDIAILYRTNAQSRAIVDTFIVNHIPPKNRVGLFIILLKSSGSAILG